MIRRGGSCRKTLTKRRRALALPHFEPPGVSLSTFSVPRMQLFFQISTQAVSNAIALVKKPGARHGKLRPAAIETHADIRRWIQGRMAQRARTVAIKPNLCRDNRDRV